MHSNQEYQLGNQSAPIMLDSSRDNYNYALQMLKQSKRQVCIFTRKLDGRLYDDNEFSQAIRYLCSHHPRIEIRILLQDVEAVVSHDHRILELSRRFSSAISLRAVHPDYKSHTETFMLFDERGVIHRRSADRYEGTASFNNPYQARQLIKFFNEVWDLSETDPNFRRLHL